jgi:hypothetical protein
MTTSGRPNGESGEGREQRRRRAVIAQRLLSSDSEAIGEVEWDVLDRAPAWLALNDSQLAIVMRQVGAIVCAPQIRLWIDGARLAAARAALGDAFVQALAAQRDAPWLPPALAPCPRIDTAEKVGAELQAAGAAVLLATLPTGPLRRVLGDVLGAAAAPMAAQLAQSFVERAGALVAQCAAAPAVGAKS